MHYNVSIYKNMLWEILDEGSKIFILTLLIENGFQGECKLISMVAGETTIMKVSDSHGKSLELPINILDILNG